MNTRTWKMLALAAVLVAPTQATAQAPDAEGRRGMHPIQRLLEHRAELGLSAEQVTRLEGIQTRLQTQNRPLLEQLRAARPAEGQRPRDLTQEQRAELRQRREALRPVMDQLRTNARAAADEVRTLLTDEQRDKLRERARDGRDRRGNGRHRGMRPGRGMGRGPGRGPGRG